MLWAEAGLEASLLLGVEVLKSGGADLNPKPLNSPVLFL